MNKLLACLLPTILAIIAYKKKKINLYGTLLAWILTFIITLIGGYKTFMFVLLTFLSTIIASKFPRKIQIDDIVDKTQAKDIFQIIANLFIPTISIIIYYFTNNKIFLFGFICTIGESLADSLASEIGTLSKSNPIDILHFKKVSKGLSGGVSILGLSAAFFGAFLMAILSKLFYDVKLLEFIIIIILIFVGTIIDSLLGTLIQVKYKCQKCQKITEKKYHCLTPTVLIKGNKYINNDMVNLLSNVITLINTLIIAIFLI